MSVKEKLKNRLESSERTLSGLYSSYGKAVLDKGVYSATVRVINKDIKLFLGRVQAFKEALAIIEEEKEDE